MSANSLVGKRILVTGGAGFIGSTLTKRLLTLGSDVLVYDNLLTGSRDFLPMHHDRLGVEIGNVLDADHVTSVVEAFGPHVVYHLAAIHYIPYCLQHPIETLQTNLVGTQAILNACAETGLEAMVHASSAAVYATHDTACSEADRLHPTDIYGISKKCGEELLRLFWRQTQAPCSAARLFNVYGPNETNPHLIPEVIGQIARGEQTVRLGNLEPKRDFIYVTDVVDALVVLASNIGPDYEVYNVGTGREYSAYEVASMILRLVDPSIEFVSDSSRRRETERLHLLADNSKLRRLGWHPRFSLHEGLAQTVSYELERLRANPNLLSAI